MSDILFYIVIALELLGCIIYTIYKWIREKNNTVVKRKYILFSLIIFAALDALIMVIYSQRIAPSIVIDFVYLIGLYLLHTALFITYLYVVSLKINFDGNNLVKKSIFKKTLVDLNNVKDIRKENESYVVLGVNKQISFNDKYVQNTKQILANLDYDEFKPKRKKKTKQ